MTGPADAMKLSCPSLPGDAPLKLDGTWRVAIETTYGKVEIPKEPIGPGNQNSPSGLYNGMIAPLIPFAMRGAIWYQGESNADRAIQYQTLFPTLIRDWRRLWSQLRFGFYFVQLANYMARAAEPVDCQWAELREAQTMTLSLPETGMAVAIDIGDGGDIHPANKQDVGLRLALAALHTTYGKKDVVPSGPLYKNAVRDGKAMRITFDYADGLKARGDRLTGFSIAGRYKKFVWADAKIDKQTVIVSSPSVPEPAAVRYAWANNPDCNLYNAAGLPASPFRTDRK
jgi:sialate O-acetylesterase